MLNSDRNSVAAPSSRIGIGLLDALLLISLIALPLAWFFDPFRITWGPIHTKLGWGWKPIVIPLALLLVRQALITKNILPRGFLSRSTAKKLLASWLVTWGFFVAIEGSLALAGVKPEASSPIVVRGEEEIDTKVKENDHKVISDPELLWRFVPGVRWDGLRINSLGFRDHEMSAQKPAGVRRVIAMGDSCTAQGHPPYSILLDTLLQKSKPTDEPWQAFNTGVFGYSSLQGLRQFQNTVRNFQPDVVTLYYGWNDHWLYDKPDHLRLAVRLNPVRAKLTEALQKKRFFGVLARMARSQEMGSHAVANDQRVNRVPAPMYRATLTEFVANIRAVGAIPLLITASRRNLTDAIVQSGHATNVDEMELVHDEYVKITREVAATTGAPLLDLAEIMAGPEFDEMFSGDGIHFDQPGLDFIAEQLHAKLMELGTNGLLESRGANIAMQKKRPGTTPSPSVTND